MMSFLATLFVVACGGGRMGASVPQVEEQDGPATRDGLPALPASGCGGPDYGWVPLGEVGRVVAHEQDTTFSLPAGTIDALLTGQGYGDFTPVPYGVLLYKVRYTTQDRGDLIEVTGYAAFPDVREPQRLPMLLWTHPTVGFSDACAPTAIGLAGAALPVLLASQGYVVAAPDYIGMNGWGVGSDRPHPWAVAEPTALASLDMARATIALRDDLGLLASPDPGRIVAWGASQGGHAALFADRYAAGYAPDVAPMAVVATIPPTDLKALSVRGVTEFSQTTTGLAGALVAAARWYQAGADLGEVLQAPFDAVLPTAMDTLCEDFGQVATGVDEVSDVWQEDYVAALTAGNWDELDPWECYLEDSSIVSSPVPYASAAAVLLVTGEDDDLAWAPAARADVQPMCDQGYTVQHVECAGADHVGAAVESLPLQLSWIEDRLRGDPVEDACTTREPGPCDGP